jgi:hypothetical protein
LGNLLPLPSGDRLALPEVTLCAVTSVNVVATIRSLEACLSRVAFAGCKLLTDTAIGIHHPEIEVVTIPRLNSSVAYSAFILSRLVDHVKTSHCLVVQWDGHILNPDAWRREFLDYDYIGASWPQFEDGHDVGNGGFSLRSRRLMEFCRNPEFRPCHPEDIAIGRLNRAWLENRGMRFARRNVADAFATERSGDPLTSFGFHGVFNMPRAIGLDPFWQVYRTLDDLTAVHHDFAGMLKEVGRGPSGIQRMVQMIAVRTQHGLRGRAPRMWGKNTPWVCS